MSHTVLQHRQRDLSPSQAQRIAELEVASMDGSTKTIEHRLNFILSSATSNDPEQYHAVRQLIWDDGRPIAHARTFQRTIFVDEQPLRILALATVCSAPDRRGEGLGKLVVSAAFQPVDQGDVEFSLFQTGVPEFYRKLNCQLINNVVVNRRDTAAGNPFNQADVMIYPANRPWPSGIVDLNGEGY